MAVAVRYELSTDRLVRWWSPIQTQTTNFHKSSIWLSRGALAHCRRVKRYHRNHMWDKGNKAIGDVQFNRMMEYRIIFAKELWNITPCLTGRVR